MTQASFEIRAGRTDETLGRVTRLDATVEAWEAVTAAGVRLGVYSSSKLASRALGEWSWVQSQERAA